MSVNERLAARCRTALAGEPLVEKRMFGGLAFLVNGHMACGVLGDQLVVWLGDPDTVVQALKLPGVDPMDFTGKPSRIAVYVGPQAYAGPGLRQWIAKGVAHAHSKPPKAATPTPKIKQATPAKSAPTGRRKPGSKPRLSAHVRPT